MYEELKGHGFVVITVAVDGSADEARPWIEAARPTHPALIDPRHVVPDLYNMVNVPTVVWIGEDGSLVRGQDVAFPTDTFREFHRIDSTDHLDAIRRWVRTGDVPGDDAVEASVAAV